MVNKARLSTVLSTHYWVLWEQWEFLGAVLFCRCGPKCVIIQCHCNLEWQAIYYCQLLIKSLCVGQVCWEWWGRYSISALLYSSFPLLGQDAADCEVTSSFSPKLFLSPVTVGGNRWFSVKGKKSPTLPICLAAAAMASFMQQKATANWKNWFCLF